MKKLKILFTSEPETLTGIVNFGYAQVAKSENPSVYNGTFPLPEPKAGNVWVSVALRTKEPKDFLNKEVAVISQKTPNKTVRYGISRDAITQVGLSKSNSSELGRFSRNVTLLKGMKEILLEQKVDAELSTMLLQAKIQQMTESNSRKNVASAPSGLVRKEVSESASAELG